MNHPFATRTRWIKSLASILGALLFGLLLNIPAAAAIAPLSHAPEDARAYLIEPSNGQTVSPEFTAKFGLVGMQVAPAGVDQAGTGHHHLLIDLAELPPLTEPLPANEHIKHFGKGQTEAQLTLTPGKHTLQLLLGNYSHVPHDHPVISEPITITVK
ncbi:DUF4399 domain-containing protein [filamentous cyanobacterium LEGE 11480]|uniref:DUF4399 domain-containing protein n=1 Tax=Romeriopsis navalis LEGE 11480 TaxID=2777977 RepID=A0A928VM83_9CYAN|nr:DUF4399 domain-containing protein [Romeriopsis navalis]MBE9030278.1 DUF4399 domain-containing protein [Romeriopsis navalis LEGE 11480]